MRYTSINMPMSQRAAKYLSRLEIIVADTIFFYGGPLSFDYDPAKSLWDTTAV